MSVLTSLLGGNKGLGKQVRGVITPAVHVPLRRAGAAARYGIGEVLHLTNQVVGAPPAQNMWWTKVAGNGTLVTTGVAGHGKATYTAPDGPTTVTLELRTGAGPASFSVLDRHTFQVIAPAADRIRLVKFGNKHHRQGLATAGFEAVIVFGPEDVSFLALEMREYRGTVNATGVLAGSAGVLHHKSAQWIPARDLLHSGTRFHGYDTVANWGINPPPSGWLAAPNLTVVGTFNWPIQWAYRLAGQKATKTIFAYAEHAATVYADGSMLLKKANESVATDLNAATDECHGWADYYGIAVPQPAPPP
jgi:hypothetical protein